MPLARGLYYSCRAAASGTPDEATTTTGTTTTTTTMMTMTGTTNTQAATTTTTITTTASKTNTTTTTTTRTTKKTTSTSTTTMLTNTAEHGDCGDGDDAGMTIRYRTDADPYDIMVVKTNQDACLCSYSNVSAALTLTRLAPNFSDIFARGLRLAWRGIGNFSGSPDSQTFRASLDTPCSQNFLTSESGLEV